MLLHSVISHYLVPSNFVVNIITVITVTGNIQAHTSPILTLTLTSPLTFWLLVSACIGPAMAYISSDFVIDSLRFNPFPFRIWTDRHHTRNWKPYHGDSCQWHSVGNEAVIVKLEDRTCSKVHTRRLYNTNSVWSIWSEGEQQVNEIMKLVVDCSRNR